MIFLFIIALLGCDNKVNKEQQLYEAALGLDGKKIDKLIAEGADINRSFLGDYELPPLHYLVAKPNTHESIGLLLDKGADINLVEPKTGNTPIMQAFTSPLITDEQKVTMISYLIKRGAHTNVKDGYQDKYLLHLSVGHKNKEHALKLTKAIVENGEQKEEGGYKYINIVDPSGMPALYYAIFNNSGIGKRVLKEGDLEILRYLIAKGADPNMKLETFVRYGALGELIEDMRLSITHDGRNNRREDVLYILGQISKEKKLYEAALNADGEKMDKLIAEGADINGSIFRDSELPTLHYLVDNNRYKPIGLFLDKGANINLVAKDKSITPLMSAFTSRWMTNEQKTQMISYLIKRGARTDITGGYKNKYLLHLFVGNKDREYAFNLAKAIVENGEQKEEGGYKYINIVDPDGRTVLYYALFADDGLAIQEEGSLEIVKYLIANGADANVEWNSLSGKITLKQFIEVNKIYIGDEWKGKMLDALGSNQALNREI